MKHFLCVWIPMLFFLLCTHKLKGQAETKNPTFPFWKIKGNSGTHTGTNFIGTTDNFSLAFRTNNLQRMVVDSLGRVGIGTSFALQKLHIGGVSNSIRIDGLATGGSFITAPANATDKLLYADANGDLRAIDNGAIGQTLTINNNGEPGWATAGGNNWSTTGNINTNVSTNFLGTLDAVDLAFRVNNIRAGLLERSTTGNTFYGFKAGDAWLSGSSNVLVGTRATEGWDGGSRNAVFGAEAGAGFFGVVRNDNTLIGYQAGFAVDVNSITAIGSQAGFNNQYGKFNTYLGHKAGYYNKRGSYNVFVGDSAGISLDILQSFGITEQNIFVGSKAGRDVRIGSDNTLMGYMTGMFQQGDGNTLLGSQAASGIFGNTQMDGNTAVGYRAGYNIFTGQNTFVGYAAGFNKRNATSVTAIGYAAGFNGTSSNGSNSVYVGDSAGYAGNDGSYFQNTFIGSKAGREINRGSNNVALGFRAMSNMFNGNANISNSVAIGAEAGHESGDADNSVFIGYRSGYTGFNSDENIFIGSLSGSTFLNNTHKNTVIGNSGAANGSNASNNVLMGYQTASTISNSDENVVIGYQTSPSLQTSSQNVFIGANISNVNSSQHSVAIGDGILTGSSDYTTLLGSGTLISGGASLNATAIGANAVVSQDNSLILGNNANVGIGTSAPASKLHVAGLTTGVRFEGLATSGLFVTSPLNITDRIMYADASGNLYAIPSGSTNQVLTFTAGGPAWASASASSAWNITGNSGTSSSTNFLGTTDNVALRFKVNGANGGFIDHIGFNSFFGALSGNVNTGTRNTLIGYNAGVANVAGVNNTFVGFAAGLGNTSGSTNIAVGKEAGNGFSSGHSNIAIGEQTLNTSNTLNYQVAIGDSALYNNTGGTGLNTAIGTRALLKNTSGTHNTAVGYSAASASVTGADNTVVGYSSLSSGSSIGSFNSVLGAQVSTNQSVGASNVLIGYFVPGSAFAVGDNNLIAGAAAGNQLNGTIGDNNVILGKSAGIVGSSATSSDNVIIGEEATASDPAILGITNTVLLGRAATSQGSINNTVIGANAKSTFTNTTTGSTVLGANAQVTLANNFILGDTISRPQVGIGVTAVGKTLAGTRFEIASEGTNDNVLFRYSGVGSPVFNFQRSVGSLASPASVSNSTDLGAIEFHGYDGNSWESAARILVEADSTTADEQVPGRLVFSTRSVAGSAVTEAMRINRNGYVGIGTTAPDTRLVVNGGISALSTTVNISADNQLITVGDRTYIRLSSNFATGTSRTVTLSDGLEIGQILIITSSSATANFFELVDEDTQAGTNTQTGVTTILMGEQDSATFIWDGTDWVMLSQRNNN